MQKSKSIFKIQHQKSEKKKENNLTAKKQNLNKTIIFKLSAEKEKLRDFTPGVKMGGSHRKPFGERNTEQEEDYNFSLSDDGEQSVSLVAGGGRGLEKKKVGGSSQLNAS